MEIYYILIISVDQLPMVFTKLAVSEIFSTINQLKLLSTHLFPVRLICAIAFYMVVLTFFITKLQRIQNTAARFVSRTCSRDHITPVLHQLHWLPVKFRIMYKILLLTYKCLHGLAHDYLAELIQEYKPS